MIFQDRSEAGAMLANALMRFKDRSDIIVAEKLGVPLDLLVSKTIRLPENKKKAVIVIDDGVTTEDTAFAALRTLHECGIESIILAAPVASEESVRMFDQHTYEIEVLHMPVVFASISQFYKNFPEVTNSEVQYIFDSVKKRIC